MTQLFNTIKDTGFEGITVKKLAEHEAYEIVLITLEGGAKIPSHVANRDAQLVMLEGRIKFHIEDETYDLSSQQTIHFDKNITHWVEAEEDSKFVLVK
ncbi:MAG: cupin domain-containing protein [Bacteroidia bacterium]|nr:cupin domain-containing protein [Bacteroidia bacterium]NNF82817.1 cupin domain-containing protein [Flavobacteriaceae bacterium]NNL80134.1 cupin domain-containing protein [Flavobacteriaceae bacterium]